MRTLYTAAAFIGLIVSGSAHAGLQPGTPIYSDFLTAAPDLGGNANFPVALPTSSTGGSPLGQEFLVANPETITGLTLRLSDVNPSDGGSVLVFLVPDPTSSILMPINGLSVSTVPGAVELAAISDAALPSPTTPGCAFGAAATIDACNTTIVVDDAVTTPGDYWIALVNGSDAANGGTNPNSSGAVWWRSGDNIPDDAPANTLYNVHVSSLSSAPPQPSDTLVDGGRGVTNAFEMQVDAPEPASMALLGAGLAGVGFVRRRGAKKSAG